MFGRIVIGLPLWALACPRFPNNRPYNVYGHVGHHRALVVESPYGVADFL